ncbi:MAG: hypothetical protein U1D67_03405, partial [Dehalococcoidia bacterium]|nr:hypothetical protein [Dehalococcoidia bacterium]
LFHEEVFNIPPADIEKNIALLIGRPEFTDIKAVEASTGARYLFSNTYLDENYARSLIEWQEVEQYANQ